MKSEKQKMLAGELYDAGDPELQADIAANMDWLARYNAALGLPGRGRPSRPAARTAGGGGATGRRSAAAVSLRLWL